MFTINFGTRSDDPQQPVVFPESVLHEHTMIYGGIGRGKSKLLEHLLRQLMNLGRPFCLIDPHGDLAEDLLAYIHHFPDKVSPNIRENLCYLEPSHPDWCFSFDPFVFRGAPEGFKEWFHARIKHVTRMIMKGETTPAPRLRRILPLFVAAVATPVDDLGTHLSLADIELLLHPGTPDCDTIVEEIAPRLSAIDRPKALGLQKLLSDRRRFDDQTDSTNNRLSGFLCQRVRDILSAPTATLDFREIVRRGTSVIVNLSTHEERFDREHADAFGEMLIRELVTAVQHPKREDRNRYHLIVDEASRFVSTDLALAFREARKWQLSLCLATQDVSSLNASAEGSDNALARAAGLANLKITFRQDDPADLEHLGKMMAYKRIDRSRKIIEVDRQVGWETKVTRSRGQTESEGENWHAGTSENERYSWPMTGANDGQRQTGTADTQGGGGSRSRGRTETEQEVLVPKYQVEQRDEGMKHPLNEQIADGIADVSELEKQYAMVQYAERPPIEFRVADVPDANRFCLPGTRQERLEEFKAEVSRRHPSLFRRSEIAINDDERLRKFLAAARQPQLQPSLVIEAQAVRAEPAYLDATEQPGCPIAF